MPRGLHINNARSESKDHLIPSPESPPSTAATQLQTQPKKKKKFDPTSILKVYIDNGRLLPSSECSRRCTYYFKQRNDEEGVNWKNVPSKTKGFYWGEFKKYIIHPGFIEEEVYLAWNKKATNRYKNWMNSMYRCGIKPLKGIEQKNWDRWTRYWQTDEFQEKNVRRKKNYERNGMGMVNHSGGSQTFEVALESMGDNGLYPEPVDFHLHTHNREDKEIIFCNKYAKEVYAEYLAKEKVALSQLQLEVEVSGSSLPTQLSRSEKAALFKDAVDCKKKRKYGSGSDASKFYTSKRRCSSSSTLGLSSPLEVVELQKKVLYLEETLAHEREERKATEIRIYKMMKKMLGNNKRRHKDEKDDDDENDDHTTDDEV